MECERIRERLSEHLDGQIAPEERSLVEAHLVRCPACRGELHSLKRVSGALRGLARIPAPAGLAGEIRERLARQQLLGGPLGAGAPSPKRIHLWVWAKGAKWVKGISSMVGVAAAALVLVIGQGVFQSHEKCGLPPSPDSRDLGHPEMAKIAEKYPFQSAASRPGSQEMPRTDSAPEPKADPMDPPQDAKDVQDMKIDRADSGGLLQDQDESPGFKKLAEESRAQDDSRARRGELPDIGGEHVPADLRSGGQGQEKAPSIPSVPSIPSIKEGAGETGKGFAEARSPMGRSAAGLGQEFKAKRAGPSPADAVVERRLSVAHPDLFRKGLADFGKRWKAAQIPPKTGDEAVWILEIDVSPDQEEALLADLLKIGVVDDAKTPGERLRGIDSLAAPAPAKEKAAAEPKRYRLILKIPAPGDDPGR